MRKITLTVMTVMMSLGMVFSQTTVDHVLYLPFDTEKIPDGEDRVSIVDSTDAVHHNPTTVQQRWLEYEGGVLVDTSAATDSTEGRGTVLQIDDHTFLKVEEKFFEENDQWTISYWSRWIQPPGWWSGHANWFGTDSTGAFTGGWTHWKGWYGWAELAGLGGFSSGGLNNDGQKFHSDLWLHVTIAYHDSTLTYYMADSTYSLIGMNLNEWESNSYWLSCKGEEAEGTQSGWKLQIMGDSSGTRSQEMQVDDFRLYDIALTEGEVASMHNGEDIMRTYISSISIGSESGEMEVKMEDSLQMTADISPEDATVPDIDWSIEEGTGSATVNDTGLVKPEAVGTVTVKATATDGSGVTATQEITITGVLITDIVVSSAHPGDSVQVDSTLQMSVDVTPDDASDTTVSWSVVNGTGSALIDEEGVLTGVLAGTVDVIATANDASDMADTLEVVIYEELNDISLSAESETITMDETLEITAETVPEGADATISWSVEDGTGSATIEETGDLTAELTPEETGTVTVVAEDANSDVQGSLEITIEEATGISDPIGDAIKVYPNPSDGTFNISLNGVQPAHYEVYNVIGAKLQSGILQPDDQLELKSTDEGVYYLKLSTDKGEIIKKLIVQ